MLCPDIGCVLATPLRKRNVNFLLAPTVHVGSYTYASFQGPLPSFPSLAVRQSRGEPDIFLLFVLVWLLLVKSGSYSRAVSIPLENIQMSVTVG